MLVYLARSEDLNKIFLKLVSDILTSVNGPLEFIVCQKSCKFDDDKLTWDRIFSEASNLRNLLEIDNDDFLILLTSKPNDKNWFSGWDPNGSRSIFIHAADWQSYILCEEQFPVAFEVVASILQALMFVSIEEGVHIAHDPPIGCVNDMCSWKPDITFKLRTADICEDCQEIINQRAIDKRLVIQSLALFEIIREKALFCRNIHQDIKIQRAEIPFPIAITQRKMVSKTEPFQKFLMLLDHFDSLVRCAVIFTGKVLLQEKFIEFFNIQRLNIKPSLGHWVAALKKLVVKRTSEDTAMLRLPGNFFDKLNEVVKKAEEYKIVKTRNEERGHGYCRFHDNSYRELFYLFKPTIAYIEEQLLFIFNRFVLYYVNKMTQPKHNKFIIYLKSLSGDNPLFFDNSIEMITDNLADLPRTDAVSIFDTIGNRWYCVHPFILYRDCPSCKHDRVLITDGEKYLDPYVGHLVTLDIHDIF